MPLHRPWPLAAALTLALLPHGVRAEDDVELEIEATPAPPPPAAPAPADDAALRATIAALEARLKALEEREAAAPAPAPKAPPEVLVVPVLDADAPTSQPLETEHLDGDGPAPAELTAAQRRWRDVLDTKKRRWWDTLDLRVSGYLQAQAELHDLSEDELAPDGTALNQDRFLIRRGRLRVDRYWKYAAVGLELDANTVRGPFVSLRRAEISFFLPNQRADLPPLVMATVGLSEIPFGFEMRQGPRQRVFMERSTGSLAFFRAEPDLGVRLSGAVGPFRYAIAAQNGVPLDDRPNAVTTVFNHQKTVVGRLGFEVQKPERYAFSGGASFLYGTGFHPGTTETKSELLWRDLNQDGVVSLNELVAAPGQAATPSSTFPRWAVNADLQLGVRTPIGWTRLYGELTLATNLDRSYFPADPISTGCDLRELSWYAAFVQEITPYALIGLRADGYDPDADLFSARRGLFVPEDAGVLTISPVAGLQLPRRGRLVAQYDHLIDTLGRDDRGEPVDLKNDRWTVRMQVEF